MVQEDINSYILSLILKVSHSHILSQEQKEYIISNIHGKKINFQLLEQLEALINRQDIFFENYFKDIITEEPMGTDTLTLIQSSLSKLKIEESRRKEAQEDFEALEDILKDIENI
jgi:hypothetical protein